MLWLLYHQRRSQTSLLYTRVMCVILVQSTAACSIHIAMILYAGILNVWLHVGSKIALGVAVRGNSGVYVAGHFYTVAYAALILYRPYYFLLPCSLCTRLLLHSFIEGVYRWRRVWSTSLSTAWQEFLDLFNRHDAKTCMWILISSSYLFITHSSFVYTTLLATLQLIVQYESLIKFDHQTPLLYKSCLCYWCCLTLSPALSIVTVALYPGQQDIHRYGDYYTVSKECSRCESWLQFQEECMQAG